jgi:hypothetical protein
MTDASNTPSAGVDLLPCPFCGGDSVERVSTDNVFIDAVWCGSCLATMPPHDPDVPNAVRRWNTRSHAAPKHERVRPLTMQDVRLMAGEGELSAVDVLAACNAVLRTDPRYATPPAPGEDVVLVARDELARIRASMCLLQQNSEGCAQNHYGGDHEIHGMPGWLADTERDVQALTAMLAAAPSPAAGEGS